MSGSPMPQVARGDLAGDVGAVSVDRMIMWVGRKVTEFDGCVGVAVKCPGIPLIPWRSLV